MGPEKPKSQRDLYRELNDAKSSFNKQRQEFTARMLPQIEAEQAGNRSFIDKALEYPLNVLAEHQLASKYEALTGAESNIGKITHKYGSSEQFQDMLDRQRQEAIKGSKYKNFYYPY